jgi:hypothetical protein
MKRASVIEIYVLIARGLSAGEIIKRGYAITTVYRYYKNWHEAEKRLITKK